MHLQLALKLNLDSRVVGWVEQRPRATVSESGLVTNTRVVLRRLTAVHRWQVTTLATLRLEIWNMGCGTSKPLSESPESQSTPNLPNVIVFGHTGGGVSSVVNLIVGEEVATVSHDTLRCTKRVGPYQVDDPGRARWINLYDIPGFDDTGKEFVQFPSVPISLAIICAQDTRSQMRVTAKYLQHRWSEHGNIPVLIVVNHTTHSPDAGWWRENEKHFINLAAFKDHACLTRGRENESKILLHALIREHLPRQ
ncbi:hypothetical protein PAXINDRAFT_180885 [Paxillus involutus ATCC 200175]|uniref:G domain-containing protein n=1 Tax=Paxillus involutus ATCC 200175 TaxID=664439 RepID=A0A0C9SXW7_PAXIN|nr:hypothetical protein PAXINDRAFT_180885 [Paxillus involutus ATCC 200175]